MRNPVNDFPGFVAVVILFMICVTHLSDSIEIVKSFIIGFFFSLCFLYCLRFDLELLHTN